MRALRRVVEDADVQRALERDAARDDDEEAVLPEGGVVRGELLLRRDERVQPLVVVAEGLEGDAVRIEAAEVGEPPVLVGRRRQRQSAIALEQVSSRHGASWRRIADGGSG